MPFTQVTLINDSDSEADAQVHIDPVGSGEDWVSVTAPPAQSAVGPYGMDDVDTVYAKDPKGNDTRVELKQGSNPGILKLGADINVVAPEVMQSVMIRIDPAGMAMLHAFSIDPNTLVMNVQSQPMT